MENLTIKSTEQLPPADLGTPNGPPRSNGLPSPVNFPNADVVIYDGQCVFCTSQVTNLMRMDGKNRLAFVSLHDPFIKKNFPDLTHDQLMEQIYLIPSDAEAKANLPAYSPKRLGGASALRYLTRRLPKLWIFAPFLHLPCSLPIWQWGYKQVAKRRYKIAGKANQACDDDGTCELHFKD
ncbi:MAG: DUF393 domain-containing protein [Mariniblastus sp.]|nr:DUF393 domain-containing protein [Mariniblastus sp.]